MAPLIALVLGTLAARLVGWLGVDYVDGWPSAIAVGLAAMFVVTGIAHFVNPLRRDLIAIVPPRLPAPGLLVTVTGVLELLGAAGLLYPPTRVAAAVSLGRADAGDVPRQRLRVADAESAEVDEHATAATDGRADRLRRRRPHGWPWRHPVAMRTGTPPPSSARSVR